MRYRPTVGSVLFDGLNLLFLLLLSLSFVYPIIMTLAISLSNVTELGYKNVGFLPIGFSLESYRHILSDARILRYYANTIIYALMRNRVDGTGLDEVHVADDEAAKTSE